MNNELKLHLGCGNVYIPGYVNIDISDLAKGAEVITDISNLDGVYEDEEVDVIYACHVLEYFDWEKSKDVLKNWYKKLKPGGILRIAVPDFNAMVHLYANEDIKLDDIIGPLFGKWTTKYGKHIYHKTVYDEQKLLQLLEEVGFTDAIPYDWKETEHSEIDDYSKAYLPHSEIAIKQKFWPEDDYTLISLNIEAFK